MKKMIETVGRRREMRFICDYEDNIDIKKVFLIFTNKNLQTFSSINENKV